MSLKYLLPFATSILLVDASPLFSLPTQTIAQLTANESVSSSDSYRNCQRTAPAVVTIYAGREIGSGSIVSSDGLVVTNHHVVQEVARSGGRRQLFVRMASGERYTGKLLGTDTRNDLALVKINVQGQFPIVRLAGTDSVRTGQRVCAIGSPYGRPGVLSQGTFSGFRRNGDLKSAVLLHPGNSGGPLLNGRGEMIGINKAIWESASGENTGISFATRASVVKDFVERTYPGAATGLVASQPPVPVRTSEEFPATSSDRSSSSGNTLSPDPMSQTSAGSIANPGLGGAELPSRFRLGVIVDTQSLIVRRVEFGSPAAVGGLKPGDHLIAINGTRLGGFEELQAFLNQHPNSALFTVRRNQQMATMQVNF